MARIAMEGHASVPIEEPLVSRFNMVQARQHYDRVLVEEEREPVSAFRQVLAEQHYTTFK